jgi:hypothetical protein
LYTPLNNIQQALRVFRLYIMVLHSTSFCPLPQFVSFTRMDMCGYR